MNEWVLIIGGVAGLWTFAFLADYFGWLEEID